MISNAATKNVVRMPAATAVSGAFARSAVPDAKANTAPRNAAPVMSPRLRARHVAFSRRGLQRGPIDEALELLGWKRNIVAIVGGFSTAVALAKASDLVATVPERHTGVLLAGAHRFLVPVPIPEITISLLWHPRLDADQAHRWLRKCVREVCAQDVAGEKR